MAEPVTPARLLQLLSDSVVFPKQSVRAAHRLVAALVAVAMLILPLLYIGFIAGVAGLTWWHIRYDWIWMKVSFGYASIMAAALYIGLGLGGILWSLSLVRPLFMSFRSGEKMPGLSRAEEPVLYAFAERLADRVGCPRPQIIRLNLDVNASAGYETSLFGLRRRAFTLTLGLPLVRGLTLCQLAGIMAHEFGHFGQRNSSFLTRFITRTNSWFVVAVSERDLLDAFIETLSEAGHYLATLVAFLLLVLARLGRYVLLALTYVGLFASTSLLRRMEFDADGYEIAVIGSDEFAAALRRVLTLSAAEEAAFKYTFRGMSCRILPSDLVAFITELADRAPRVKKRAKKMLDKEVASLFASHPPVRDRLALAKKLNLPGVLKSSLPGTVLFRSFDQRSTAVTLFLYEHHHGRGLTADAIRPASEVVDAYLESSRDNPSGIPAGRIDGLFHSRL